MMIKCEREGRNGVRSAVSRQLKAGRGPEEVAYARTGPEHTLVTSVPVSQRQLWTQVLLGLGCTSTTDLHQAHHGSVHFLPQAGAGKMSVLHSSFLCHTNSS